MKQAGIRSALALIGFLALSAAVAVLGSIATIRNVDGWYAEAAKAAWNPPAAVFGPVWTVLYAAMAVSAWLIWRRRKQPGARAALLAYAVQLVLNAAWTPVFFAGYLLIGPAALWIGLAVILLLDAAVLVTMILFLKISRAAGWLLLPYLLWLLYASTLNLAIGVLNT